jgi:ribosomal protein S18 acetylase RimI-like enzyme
VIATAPSVRRPPRVTIRRADRSDHADLCRVLNAAYRQYEVLLSSAAYGAYLADLCDVTGRSRRAEVLVAEYAGLVVGTATFYPDAGEEGMGWPSGWAGVRAVGVRPSARGHGVAQQLMDECRRRAAVRGAKALCLHTASFMRAAVGLYERLGYQRAPQFDVDVAPLVDPGAPEPIMAIGYVLPLTSSG